MPDLHTDQIERTRTNLTEVPRLYRECAHLISPPRGGWVRERVTGSRDHGVVNDTMVEARSTMRTVLGSWTALLCREQGLGRRPEGVPMMARLLSSHLGWFVEHPAWTDFSDELDRLVTDVHHAVDGASLRTSHLGPCIRPGCEGTIVLTISLLTPDRRPGVACDTGHAWLPHQWLQLKNRIETMEDIGTPRNGDSGECGDSGE
ncbi:hypothetical protein, partial [Streptomyces sp. SBT349]|uniref:hypothetical protein n=1 Tax=Streptomyces sp. SBT349 TaxID=1580539 RepID=UPI00066E8189